jgi:hypothetical protein
MHHLAQRFSAHQGTSSVEQGPAAALGASQSDAGDPDDGRGARRLDARALG